MSHMMGCMAGSRRQPRGSQKLHACAVAVHRKDVNDLLADPDKARPLSEAATRKPLVFFDVAVAGVGVAQRHVGRVVVELFWDTTPHTAENFRSLCTWASKDYCSTGEPLHYKGCVFHRVVPNFLVQTGDFHKGDGTISESTYGQTRVFEDECFDKKHDAAGLLSMANRGPNTNGSQFFVTSKPNKSLDGKHVVFGRISSGMDVIRRIESCGYKGHDEAKTNCMKPITGDSSDRISFRAAAESFVITECGELPPVDSPDGPATKRARHDDAQGGPSQIQALYMLKKHSSSRPSPKTWKGQLSTLTRGKAKVAVENARKRISAAACGVQVAFVEAARDASDDASAPSGGELGIVERGAFTKAVAKVAFSLQVGELSDVFESDEGFHLVYRIG